MGAPSSARGKEAKREDGWTEGGSGEAENTEQKAERPPARVANFQQLYRRRSFAPERLIISSVLDASSSSSASRYNEDRGEERSGRTLVSQNKKIAILWNRFLSRSRVNPKSGYLPPRVHASVRPSTSRERELQSSLFTPWQKRRWRRAKVGGKTDNDGGGGEFQGERDRGRGLRRE